jgi:hypothetical protein
MNHGSRKGLLGGAGPAAVLVALVALTQLPLAWAACPGAYFGTGQTTIAQDYISGDGIFHPTPDNILPLTGKCTVSGFGADTDPGHWQVQIYRCGTTSCQAGINLPIGWDSSLPPCTNSTGNGPSCTLSPVGPADYNETHYVASYNYYMPKAQLGDTDNYYYWRCFYVCDPSIQPIDNTNAEMRSDASFTVGDPVPRSPPPSPPRPSPPPPSPKPPVRMQGVMGRGCLGRT